MMMAVEADLRTARSSLQRLIERSAVLDTLAEDGRGLGELLSAACELQLDLQAARSNPLIEDARRLARTLCSELSHAAPDHPSSIGAARLLLRRLEATLAR